MIKQIGISQRRHCVLGGLAAVTLALAACDLGPASPQEVFIESVPLRSPLFAKPAGFDSESKAIHLEFDDHAFFASHYATLLYRGGRLSHKHDQGYFRPGSILSSHRTASWHGPLLVLPPLEVGRAYSASVWVKLDEAERRANAKLMWTQVSGGVLTEVALTETEVEPRAWVKLEGEFIGNPQASSDINLLSLDIDNTDTTVLVDDFIVAYAELSEQLQTAALEARSKLPNLVLNGNLARGLEPWTHQGGVISRSSAQAHTGSHSLFIAGRQQDWNAPVMPVTGLENNQRYRFSIYVRMNDGEPAVTARLTMRRETAGQTTFTSIGSGLATSSGWAEISGTFISANIRDSDEVAVYLEVEHPTASYFVDTLTVEPLR